MPTTKAARLATIFVPATFMFGVLAQGSTADARPRRVAVLDLDGPRTLADDAKSTVVGVLADRYDVVSSKHWTDAMARASRRIHGPRSWAKASKASGVDAVVEGWVQKEGRSNVMTLVVYDASNGDELDSLSIRLGRRGFTSEVSDRVRRGLDERFEWIQPLDTGNPDPLPTYNPKDKRMIGARRDEDVDSYRDRGDRDDRRSRRRRDRDDRDDRRDRDDHRDRDDRDDRRADRDRDDREDRDDRDDRRDRDRDDDVSEKRVAAIEVHTSKAERDDNVVANVFHPISDEEVIVTGGKAAHVPQPTTKARFYGGGYYGSRTLYAQAENPDGVTQFAGVPSKGIEVGGTYYPFPNKKIDGIQSGIGFSFDISHSLGSVVTFDDLDTVSDFVINQSAWNAGIHYRTPLGESFAIDGEVGYGQMNYKIEDATPTFEVPDTAYSYLSAGGHLDLKITEHSSVGFGAKYLYTLGTGDLNSVDWYGPGKSAGWNFNGNFIIPLPKNLFVEGALGFTRIKTSLDGVGQITEDEGVTETVDSTVSGTLHVGIAF